MCDIYENSVCTIAATGASHSSEGCFLEHPWEKYPLKQCVFPGKNVSKPLVVLINERYKPPGIELRWFERNRDTIYRPLDSRGWAIQERFLSPRVLHWTANGIYWECRERRASRLSEESEGKVLSGHRLASMSKDGVLGFWSDLVQHYSERSLTHESDNLVAISGVAKIFERRLREEYLAGFWRCAILEGLCWECSSRETVRDEPRSEDQTSVKVLEEHTPRETATLVDTVTGQRPDNGQGASPIYIAPTWSWASVSSAVKLPTWVLPRSQRDLISGVRVNHPDTYVTLASSDPTGALKGGQLSLDAPLLSFTVRPCPEQTRSRGPTFIVQDPANDEEGTGGKIHCTFDHVDDWYARYAPPDDILLCLALHCHSHSVRDNFSRGLIVRKASTCDKHYERLGIFRRYFTARYDEWELQELRSRLPITNDILLI
jgi:hypothetical protein